MQKDADIRYVKQSDLEKIKWDDCIDTASNGLIYGYSGYLDRMAKNWDALILNDYEMVMPLPWNRKFGIAYLYQPPFTASLGVFGAQLNEQIVSQFIRAIPDKFKLVEIPLNFGNQFPSETAYLRKNYILDLNRPYEAIYLCYRENVKRNIKRAKKLGCIFKKDVPVGDIIALSKPVLKHISNITDEDYFQFEKLFSDFHEKRKAATFGVYSATGELLSSCVYLFSHGRAYYILVGNHPKSKAVGASHFLIDRFIDEYANQHLLLDFEGSDIHNLAFFYSSFGATLETYPFVKLNHLPFWMQWVK